MTAPEKHRNLKNIPTQAVGMTEIIISVLVGILIWSLQFFFQTLAITVPTFLMLGWIGTYFGNFLCSPAVVPCVVLRFWDMKGKAGVFWESSSSTHLLTCQKAMGNTEDKIAFTRLILQQNVPNPFLQSSPVRSVAVSLLKHLYFVGAPCCFLALFHHLGPTVSQPHCRYMHHYGTHQLPVPRDYATRIRAEPRWKLACMQGRWWVSIQRSTLARYVHPLSLTICYLKAKPMHI